MVTGLKHMILPSNRKHMDWGTGLTFWNVAFANYLRNIIIKNTRRYFVKLTQLLRL